MKFPNLNTSILCDKMRDKETRISVIIPSYNSYATIGKTIEMLLRQDFDKEFEIIIIDSSNDGRTTNFLKDLEDKKIKIFLSKTKLNAGEARNIGVEKSSGKIIAFLDSDCIPPIDWLKKIDKIFGKNPGISSLFGVYTGGRTILEKITGGEYLDKYEIGFYDGFIEGNCAFRRDVFKKGCRWSETQRSQYVDLADCIKNKVKIPSLWASNLKVTHLGRVNIMKIFKSGTSKFSEDRKNSKNITKVLLFFSILLAGLILLISLLNSGLPMLIFLTLPNLVFIYYIAKDKMISLKHKVFLLPYLLMLRWVFWLGWLYGLLLNL